MGEYVVIFLAGLAGSMHCLGMCGGFACMLGADRRGPLATIARHLIYNLGRVTSYCFLGGLAGYLGLLLIGRLGEGAWAGLAQRSLAVLSGILMLYIGLQFLGLMPRAGLALPWVGWAADGLRQLTKKSSPGAPLALGVINGFLPCPLVYAFVTHAAGSSHPLAGLLIMASFGLGTFPAMLLMGGAGFWARAQSPRLARGLPGGASPPGGSSAPQIDWRRQGVRIAGAFIVLIACVTLTRGIVPMSVHGHHLSSALIDVRAPLDCRTRP